MRSEEVEFRRDIEQPGPAKSGAELDRCRDASSTRAIVRRDQRGNAADRALFFREILPQASRQVSWITYLHSATVARQQCQARFMELFFSKDGTRFSGFEYILRRASNSLTLTHSLDAVCLVHIGNASKDARLREAARRTYGLAITTLRSELANPRRDPSILLAAMHLLLICELFSDTAAPDGMGARRHARGMMQMLEHYNPSHLDPAVRALLGTQLNGVAVWDAAFLRRGLRGFKNLQESLSEGATFSSATDVVSIAVRVPEVLGHAGQITRMGPAASVESILDAMNNIVALEGELQDTLTAWYERTESVPYRPVAFSQLARIHPELQNAEGIFPHAYKFKDSLSASKQHSYWVLLLRLAQGHLKLCEANLGLLILQTNGDFQRLASKAYEYADSICMSMVSDLQPESGYVALASAIFPLQIAMHWYGRKMDIPKLAWCQKTLRVFEAAGIRSPYMSTAAEECLSHSVPTR